MEIFAYFVTKEASLHEVDLRKTFERKGIQRFSHA